MCLWVTWVQVVIKQNCSNCPLKQEWMKNDSFGSTFREDMAIQWSRHGNLSAASTYWPRMWFAVLVLMMCNGQQHFVVAFAVWWFFVQKCSVPFFYCEFINMWYGIVMLLLEESFCKWWRVWTRLRLWTVAGTYWMRLFFCIARLVKPIVSQWL